MTTLRLLHYATYLVLASHLVGVDRHNKDGSGDVGGGSHETAEF